MMGKRLFNTGRALVALILVAVSINSTLYADDTEIYQITGGRPKVLIVVDDSSSMDAVLEDSTRMAVAQDVITTLIDGNPDIDFGLLEFNSNLENQDHHGGRVISRIIAESTDDDRANMIDLVNSIQAGGSTPLCESTYEAYRYLAGEDVVYGGKWDPNTPTMDIVPRDPLAEDPAETYAPPSTDCGPVFIVILTDGTPQNDTDANQRIKDLTGKLTSCGIYPAFFQPDTENCMPELAAYMADDLDGDPLNGKQPAFTYTIGFTTDQDLLRDTAAAGNGEYYTADNSADLAEAFEQAIKQIRATDSGLTSPAVAVDTFTRTESRSEVFFALFKPDNRVNWPGNIKRLDISLDALTGEALLVDDNGAAAIDPASGNIKITATTVWSVDNQDGPIVTKGGVGGLLKARNPATRVIYSNTGTNEALLPFESTNMTAAAFGFADDAELFDYFGVEDQAGLDEAIDWGKGYDVADENDDGAVDDTRWILADMLHGKPLVINYGARTNAFSIAEPDQRVVVGTNAGFLHMFNNDDGEEDWAFFAKELAPVLNERKVNAFSSEHVYGIDSTAVTYTFDLNRDGTLDHTVGDKVYLYFGLRRGGRILYAMDISNPDRPSLLWRLDPDTAGFAELGQTWSVPVITRIPGYRDANGVPKAVLVFGAGYDTNKDAQGVATPDTMGRGLFIVDAVTGSLVWSMTPAADSPSNMQETGLLHSVAAGVTVFDSNGDELSDRIYFADTGGQLWRLDLPGNTLPDSNQDTWRVVKVAQVNGGTEATDRRFFNAPDVVRTANVGAAFDAILIGSGDRTNPNDLLDANDPNDTAVDNQFYMFKDRAINPYFTDAPTAAECNATPPSVDFRCRLPLDPNDLYDVTPNLARTGTTAEQSAAQAALLVANGWRLDLENNGEKVLARSITIAGRIYITTFTPRSISANTCEPISGVGRLYVLNLFDAGAEVDFNSNGNTDRSWIIGEILPDTPSPHFGEDGQIRLLLPPGSGGGGIINSPFLTGAALPGPYGSYWYREEY